MEANKFQTESARYTVYRNTVHPGRPYCIFLHGGPGFNSFGERSLLGPLFNSYLNFIWFDLIGCGESQANSPDKLTWQKQSEDIFTIIREFGKGPVNIIAHCLAAHNTHDLVRTHPDWVRSVVWYSPANKISDVFKRVITRSLNENRMLPSTEEKPIIEKLQSTSEEKFGANDVLSALTLISRIRDFQELYWSDPSSMRTYQNFMAQYPFSPEVFLRIQSDFFARGPLPIPSYKNIPVAILQGEDDGITPWSLHGKILAGKIPHAEVHLVPGGFHWVHFQKTAECAKETLQFLVPLNDL